MVLDGIAELILRWRRHRKDWLVTVALVNRQRPSGSRNFSEELAKCSLFQVELLCAPAKGQILPYPRLQSARLTSEEEELELQYKDRKTFAIGHGIAADWELDKNGIVRILRTNFLPAVEVPLVTPSNPSLPRRALDLTFLETCATNAGDVIPELDAFLDRYAEWVADQPRLCEVEPERLPVIERITERQELALARMRRGCELLRSDETVRRAFGFAQRAMRQQIVQVRRALLKEDQHNPVTWRPFQLAFILLGLESVVDPDSSERDLLDLIWFPTGGGKTEAYLALIAILVLYRRLKWPGSCGGTVAIMRYTLRLLTAQQFQRATALICALEKLRREAQGGLGHEPITGGLWIGGASTPNTNRQALDILEKLLAGHRTSPGLFLDQCPWCGTGLLTQPGDDSGNMEPGVFQKSDGIGFRCPDSDCEFSDSLPLHVVDEHLYEHPPTLLLATVDKFARLAWEERTNAFFGAASNRPPELIIQDELHLIAGPLGSFAGLYEAAIDTVLTCRGIRPKYIASTATIRHADRQVRLLYGRDMAVFPPPGHSCDDSFFARKDTDRPGRLYVGLCGHNPLLNWRKTLGVAAATALAVPEAKKWQGELRDAWWTAVIYHGSLHGVGQSHRLALHDIPERLNRVLREMKTPARMDENAEEPETLSARDLHHEGRILELTSHVDGAGIQEVLQRLQIPCEHEDSVSLVLCTNMLSVGIDIARLALIIVNGQPLTTAEYIQATSRVGRDRVPGIVITNFNRLPRDLSHFENFRPYHESFYRFVEPTSVTPFSAPARHLALHAALVIVMRHGAGLLENEKAFLMDPEDGRVRKTISLFLERCSDADSTANVDIQEQVHRLLEEWQSHKGKSLLYSRRRNERMLPSLLRSLLDPPEKGLWGTMHSMRSVDQMSRLRVVRPFDPVKGHGRNGKL